MMFAKGVGSNERITLNKEKCKFGVSEVTFNGHRLSATGIKPIYDHIVAIRDFREPSTNEEVRSFLVLVNYVQKFIPNLATTSEPLRQLTKKGVKFEWNGESFDAYESFDAWIL